MVDAMAGQPAIELRRYWDIMVARWRTILAATFVGLLVAAAYLVLVPSSFISTTTVAVFPITTDPYAANRNSGNLLDMSAEAVTASSFKVAQIAADETDGEWAATELRRATRADASADSTTMTITVTADTEQRARSGAAVMAGAYLQARSDQAANSIESVLDRDRERIDAHREQLIDALQRLAAASPGSPEAAEAAADQQTLSLQISALLDRISSFEGIDTTGGTVLNPASMTGVTMTPSRSLVLITGVAAGLGAGIIAAFITHSRRKKVHTPRDLGRELRIDTLGVLETAPDGSVLENATALNAAQRILRMANVRKARVVAMVSDLSVLNTSALADSLSAAISESGSPAAVAPTVRAVAHTPGEVVILPIQADASTAMRLHALRISDVAVLVVTAGASKYHDVDVLIQDAEEMGTPVAGALLLSNTETIPPRARGRSAQIRRTRAADSDGRPDSDRGVRGADANRDARYLA